jgi:cysteine-S-conjugate beta-lyase
VADGRTAVPWRENPYILRLHIGLEDPDELIADLEAGLKRLAA